MTASAQLAWTTTQVELAPAPGELKLTALYPFANKTQATVSILDIKSTCGCTVPELEKKTYAPGESGELKVTFDIGSRQGPQTKLITVTTDAGETVLQLVAKLPQRLDIVPRLVLFRAKDTTPQIVKIAFRADGPVSDVTYSDPGPDFKIVLAEQQPGADYTLTITPLTAPAADLRATVVIHSKGASGQSYADTLFLRHAL